MNYEKKYRDLVEAVKELQEANPSDDGIQNWVKENVPELKESEDERIRKEIINYFRCQSRDEPSRKDIHNKWIAWLEKQKDHEDELEKAYKTADEVQYRRGYEDAKREFEKQGEHKPAHIPKFHEGQWVACAELNAARIISIVDDFRYEVEFIDGSTFFPYIDYVDKDFHRWTIKDAKEGDALVASDGSIFLFAGVANCACKYYAAFTADNTVQINKEVEGGWETSSAVHPATKEQCAILMKAIDDAGYAFNLELKKIVQKPSDKVEPKFKVGDWITDGNITIQIEAIKNGCYLYCGDCALYSIKTADKVYHLWTIQDAKDGDVLVTDFEEDNMIVMYHSMCTKDTINVHCCFDNKIICSNLGVFDAEDVKPATKNQRELLFQKLKEAGYKWDADKKELKKIGQKHVWAEKEELAKAKKDAYNQALDKIEYHSEEPSFSDGWDAAIQYLKKVILLEK